MMTQANKPSSDMMKVQSDPNVVQLIVILVVGGLFFILLGTFMIFMVAPDYPMNKQLGLTATGLGLYFFAIFAALNYFKSTPELIVTLDELTIKHIWKSETIKTNDISEVLLTQKSLYKFLFVRMPMESTIVNLRDGTSRVFWDFYYEGFGRVKNALNLSIDPNKYQKLEELRAQSKAIVTPIDQRELEIENFTDFKGTSIFNFYGLVYLVMFCVFAYNFTEEKLLNAIIGFSVIVGLSGFHLHYFRISDNYFQVRNFIWFWKSKSYRLEDILEIIHEHPTNTPESLRIRLKNFHTSNLQPAGSYRGKHWKDLFKQLREYNIKIRSEYYDEPPRHDRRERSEGGL